MVRKARKRYDSKTGVAAPPPISVLRRYYPPPLWPLPTAAEAGEFDEEVLDI
jgi:hypothetical protein